MGEIGNESKVAVKWSTIRLEKTYAQVLTDM